MLQKLMNHVLCHFWRSTRCLFCRTHLHTSLLCSEESRTHKHHLFSSSKSSSKKTTKSVEYTCSRHHVPSPTCSTIWIEIPKISFMKTREISLDFESYPEKQKSWCWWLFDSSEYKRLVRRCIRRWRHLLQRQKWDKTWFIDFLRLASTF